MDKKERIGLYLRDCRLAARLSLRQLAARIGVSHVFLGEIERGRRALPRERWQDLKAALPLVDLTQIQALGDEGGPTQFDLRGIGAPYQRAAQLLMRRAKNEDLPAKRLEQILQLLAMDGE